MSTINNWSTLDTLIDGDGFAVYSISNGDDRRCPASVVATYLEGKITSVDDKVTQYASPSATAFTVTLTDSSVSLWLVLTPTGTFATGTIKMPSVANATDKQEILVNCTQIVTALTLDANGGTVTGAPATLAANSFFKLRFDGVAKVWYRVG
jgi:hypothetical protein